MVRERLEDHLDQWFKKVYGNWLKYSREPVGTEADIDYELREEWVRDLDERTRRPI